MITIRIPILIYLFKYKEKNEASIISTIPLTIREKIKLNDNIVVKCGSLSFQIFL
jgi:hypothetical protein